MVPPLSALEHRLDGNPQTVHFNKLFLVEFSDHVTKNADTRANSLSNSLPSTGKSYVKNRQGAEKEPLRGRVFHRPVLDHHLKS